MVKIGLPELTILRPMRKFLFFCAFYCPNRLFNPGIDLDDAWWHSAAKRRVAVLDVVSESFFGMPVCQVREPSALTSPLVFNSPHSGRHYPAEFLSQTRLDRISIRKSEDVCVDDLFARAPRAGAPLHIAHFPRAYVDVNREPFELDPRM
jgi:hypothetical protein